MKRNRWKVLLTLALTVAWVGCADRAIAQAPKDTTNAALAFARLKTLAGRWEAATDKGKVSATYELVSGGSVLMERIAIAGESEMMTMYHLDGNRLVLTHYCNAGNQPHMQAQAFDPNSNEIRFDFASATNLASPEAGHMHQAVIKLGGPNELTEDWTFYQNGKPAFTVPLAYHRTS